MVQQHGGAPHVVAVIPARGGSKGVPGKNVRRVGGVPLVARAVAAAIRSGVIDAVYVSTDDAQIAETARLAGAQIIDRPADLAGDTASSEAALLHALDSLEVEPGILVFLQATSPFIDSDALAAAVGRVSSGESDVVFSAFETHGFLWRSTATGAEGVNHDAATRPRRQDREEQFQENGAFYVMRAAGFREARHRFFGRVGIAVVSPLGSVEIDTPDDFALASAIAPLVDSVEPIDIDALVTDFDGVHTNDLVHVGAGGEEFVTASRSDGMGVELLRRADVPMLILSKERHAVVAARAKKLRVDLRQGVDDKATVLTHWADARGLDLARVAYLGNDINDLACLGLVGWPIAVADAHPDVLAAARVVLTRPGGRGAIRELAERILADRNSFSPSPTPHNPEQEHTWSPSVHAQ